MLKKMEANNFEVFLAPNGDAAVNVVLDEIIPKINPSSVSWGGSMTFTALGLYDSLKNRNDMNIIDTYEKNLSKEEREGRWMKGLSADLFITGTNAVTETGTLVNLDSVGNRVAPMIFGPKNVLVLTGRNKIVSDLQAAMTHIRNYTAPTNAMRMDRKTACVKTSYCEDCQSPFRTCNSWSIIEKSFPKGRIKVVMINESLGL